MTTTPRVLFGCLHGSAKSLIALEHFRRLAKEQGVDVQADWGRDRAGHCDPAQSRPGAPWRGSRRARTPAAAADARRTSNGPRAS